MRMFKSSPSKTVKPGTIRTVVVCLLVAVLLISTSVGLGYARYTNFSPINESINFLGNDFLHSENVVISYIDRDSSDPVVLDYKGKVVATVPRGLSAESASSAYALFVDSLSDPAYNPETGKYDFTASIGVYSLSVAEDATAESGWTVKAETLSGTDASPLGLKINLSNISGVSDAVSNNSSWDFGYSASGSKLVLDYSNPGQIGQVSTSGYAFSDVKVSFEKNAWSTYAVTDWYDDAPSETEYELTSALQLAGLAKLVNDGTDFDGVTIKLANDVSLFGNAQVGDRREWTPIGTATNPFRGNFDGQGNTIFGLTLSGNNSADEIGLFGAVDGAASGYIKGFDLDDALVYAEDGKYTGTLVGKAKGYTASDIEINNLKFVVAATNHYGSIAGHGDGFTHSCAVNYVDSGTVDFVGTGTSADSPEKSGGAATADEA